MRRLSGLYGYGLFGWGGDDDFDDDCDDDDLDGDGDGDDRGHERSKKMFGFPRRSRFGYPLRSRNGPPYVIRVHIPGTGEQISIIFKSDDHDAKKGFDAVYRVTRGGLFFYTRIINMLLYFIPYFTSFLPPFCLILVSFHSASPYRGQN